MLLGIRTVQGQNYPFCLDGIAAPDLLDDGGKPSVGVVLAQAPLFSTNPKIGDKGKYFNLFHTAIVITQEVGTSIRNWTLEFDFTGGMLLKSIVPVISGTNLTWYNDARFCLTDGVLWGEKHWSQIFSEMVRLPAALFNRTFNELVLAVNRTSPGTLPQYNLWKVENPDTNESFITDITCNDGPIWLFNYLTTTLGLALPPGFVFRGTAAVVNARAVEEVNASDPDAWSDVVKYFEGVKKIVGSSPTEKIYMALVGWHQKYVYDPNQRKYFKLIGSRFPWLSRKYAEYQLIPPLPRPPPSLMDMDQQLVVV